MLDIINVLDFIALAFEVAFLVLLLKKRDKVGTDFYLLGALAAALGIYAVDVWMPETVLSHQLLMLSEVALGPLLLLYVYRLSGRTVNGRWHALFPLLNVAVLLMVARWTDAVFFEHPVFFIQLLAGVLSMIGYSVALLLHWQQLRLGKREAEQPLARWTAALSLGYIIFWVVMVSYIVLYEVVVGTGLMLLADSVLSLAALLIVAIEARRYHRSAKARRKTEPNTVDDPQRWLDLYERIDATIKKETLFLNPQLKVDDLAKRMTTNSRYISKAVNAGYGDSVTNYLNDLRLARFKERLRSADGQQYNIDVLALECGFNSKSSANRFFKLREGITPSAYRALLQES